MTVTTPLSYDGDQEASTRVDRVGPDGFDAAVEEWSYRDGTHFEETVGSLTVGSGVLRPDDGLQVAAGTVEAGSEAVRAEFEEPFSKPPVVITGSQTRNADEPVVTRNGTVSTDGLSVRLQAAERTTRETAETVGFVAVEPGAGTLDGAPFEAGVVTGVDHEWHTVEFDGEYEDPTFLADMQTSNGPDTATLRHRKLDGNSVEVFVEEERSEDDEMEHAKEDVGYLVVGGGTETERPPPDGSGEGSYGRGSYGLGSYGA